MYRLFTIKRAFTAGLMTALFSFSPFVAAALVADWQFNTLGDTEGWTASSYHGAGFKVANAASGSEIVLTSDNLQNQNDSKLYSPTGVLSLSVGATAWESYTIRIRQLGTDNTTPVAFDTNGTIAMISAGGVPTINPIHTPTTLGYSTAPVTVENQASEWNLVSYDISAYSGDIAGGFRMDPMAGTVGVPSSLILGNFEIDYITITDNAVIPEPASFVLMLLGGLMVIVCRFRQKV